MPQKLYHWRLSHQICQGWCNILQLTQPWGRRWTENISSAVHCNLSLYLFPLAPLFSSLISCLPSASRPSTSYPKFIFLEFTMEQFNKGNVRLGQTSLFFYFSRPFISLLNNIGPSIDFWGTCGDKFLTFWEWIICSSLLFPVFQTIINPWKVFLLPCATLIALQNCCWRILFKACGWVWF